MLTVEGKQKILTLATEAIATQTGLTVAIKRKRAEQQTIILKTKDATTELEVIVVGAGTAALGAAVEFCKRMQNLQQAVMMLLQINPEMAELLRRSDIQFIDTAGNCYINHPPLYLFVKGNRVQGVTKKPTVNRVFKQTGLRVLYALLCNPGMENDTYRTIAAKTGVALGMVNWVFKNLNELGFLLETGTGRAKKIRLINKEKLLERWLNAYTEQLRPKLLLGRYRGTDGWWQNAQLKPEQALWGGETAAAKLTDYLKPQEITVYLDKNNTAAMLIPNRLKKDPAGDVELVARFWQPDTITPNGDMVHPLLVYADLMATGNQRNMETARIIYDEHIIQLVREN